MWSIVIPAHNEEGRIGQLLSNLSVLPVERIIIVANGCKDKTIAEVREFSDKRLDLHIFPKELGVDVPRAVGAKIALDYKAAGVVFVDGDMTGMFNQAMLKLIAKIEEGWDMALVNCYPYIPYRHPLSQITSFFRAKLNRKLGLFHKLGIASPSHGPHAVSRRFLEAVPLKEIAIPPVSLALACQAGLKIGVAAGITHQELQSRPTVNRHGELIAQTIMGDCLEAMCLVEGRPRSRIYEGKEILGYHPNRNWDLLNSFLAF
ncbi:MAG: glycosyltransferase family 2 protein [Clostridia bacterium]|jgi:glycosyltransferase involved in cell wall biosynthesis|nr:glycosyltransferase family 2 protein [Clostridia bacterium]